jgi:hypothetical protein
VVAAIATADIPPESAGPLDPEPLELPPELELALDPELLEMVLEEEVPAVPLVPLPPSVWEAEPLLVPASPPSGDELREFSLPLDPQAPNVAVPRATRHMVGIRIRLPFPGHRAGGSGICPSCDPRFVGNIYKGRLRPKACLDLDGSNPAVGGSVPIHRRADEARGWGYRR